MLGAALLGLIPRNGSVKVTGTMRPSALRMRAESAAGEIELLTTEALEVHR